MHVRMLAAMLPAFLAVAPCAAQVVINEFMYAPESPEPEWVELFNAGTGAVELLGWAIGDGNTRGRLPAQRIAPGGFVVVTRDSAGLREARGVRGVVLAAALPAFNNAGDRVVLYDSSGVAVDSLEYGPEWGGGDGRSLERRLYTFPAAQDTSWGVCTSAAGATPARKNSVTPSGFDVAIEAVRFESATARALLLVRNVGTLRSARALVILYHDADDDGNGDRGEALDSAEIPPLEPGDSAVRALVWRRALKVEGEPGIAEVLMQADERSGNNTAEFTAFATEASGDVVINEIMFDPLPVGARAGAEYVELRNLRADAVDVSGWRIYDATLRAKATVPKRTPPIASGACLLLASDTTVYQRFGRLRDSTNVLAFGTATFALNADEDDVVLRDRGGNMVDSVHYRGDWHRPDMGELKGVALERISGTAPSNDRRNWSSSAAADGGTPGTPNTLEIPVRAAAAELTLSPRTLSPDGDGHEDFTRVLYRLPVPGARIVAVVYDRDARPVRLLASNEPAAPSGELIFDGRDDAGRALPVGLYVVVLEAYDDASSRLMRARATLVIARRL